MWIAQKYSSYIGLKYLWKFFADYFLKNKVGTANRKKELDDECAKVYIQINWKLELQYRGMKNVLKIKEIVAANLKYLLCYCGAVLSMKKSASRM
jgi:hypothetical protein